MDLETKIYKYSLMTGEVLLTILFLLYTIVYIFISQELGWGALMFVSMLISIGVFYTGWDTGRNRPEEHESEGQEAAGAVHHEES